MRPQFLLLTLFLLTANFVFAQQTTYTGTITDFETGEPLPGATIYCPLVNVGAYSDVNGQFSIVVNAPQDSMVVTYLGYTTQTHLTQGKTTFNIQLRTEKVRLECVEITTAYRKPKLAMESQSLAINRSFSNARGVTTKKSSGKRRVKSDSPAPARKPRTITNREDYAKLTENGFKSPFDAPYSTFSIDVDNASYSNVRRFLNLGQRPPVDAVRVEEMINYFNYHYPQPDGDHPISVTSELSACPWKEENYLLHVGLQAKDIPYESLPASNMVFLIDVSGSMGAENKLPLLKSSMRLLVNNLRAKDKVSIVVYAGAAGVVLPPTSGADKEKIINSLENLNAGGSTAGGAGIQLAYKIAAENFQEGGNNRVILATDGDFNVGQQSNGELERMITEKRKTGIFLTCLGYGMGNYQDVKMETLANKGNGNYAYIDNIQEAKKSLVSEFGGNLFNLAKDVKIQMEFNPTNVYSYRLIGYENRQLNDEDFNDDKKDAGEIGPGQTVTVLYEIIPRRSESDLGTQVDLPKYQKRSVQKKLDKSEYEGLGNELANLKIRYKQPEGSTSAKMVVPIFQQPIKFESTSDNFRFSSSVAMFGMLLRESEHCKAGTFDMAEQLALSAKGNDSEGYRSEFIRLVQAAK